MKKNVKKISLSRETLRDLNADAKKVFGGSDDTLETDTCLTRETCGIIIMSN